MALTTIDASKGAVASAKPLHLVTFAFADGTYLRVATHAVTYGGNAYQGRIVSENLGALQQLSQDGLDVIPNVSITLADADKAMYSYADKFYGARMTVDFVLWDLATQTYSTDSFRQFTGRCGKPECTERTLEVAATFVMQLGSRKLPTFPIQQRCPKVQPVTSDEFTQALNPDSIFYPCGLTAGQYTGACNQTREGCVANNNLLRFAGIQYNVPDAGVTREYVSGQKIDLRSNNNAAKYGDWVPIVLGSGWVDCVVTNTAPEANSTRGEAIACEGVTRFQIITVNDERPPAATSADGATQYNVANPLFRYNVLNTGNRSGRLNQDDFYKGAGDPYGSMAAFEWCVPRKAGGDSGVPRVRALVTGSPVPIMETITSIVGDGTGAWVYFSHPNLNIASNTEKVLVVSNVLNGAYAMDNWNSSGVHITGTGAIPGGFSSGYVSFTTASDNPAWNILYILNRVGVALTDVDIPSFVSAAAYADTSVAYTNQYGSMTTHKRYTCSLVIRQRTTAADVISGLLRGCNSILRWNTSTGKLQLIPKGTLADQQPTVPAGSNYSTGIPSTHAGGSFGTGYVAYRFTTANITKQDSGEWNIRRLARGITDTPNAISFGFTNSERDYVGDSISTVDANAINAAGQQVDASIKVDGVATLDQAKRVSRTFLNEIQADQWEIETDFGALKLATGHIVMIDVPKYGLYQQLMRVLKVQPSVNSETIKLTLAEHSDSWYTDTGTVDSKRNDVRRNRLARPAYAWAPYEVQPPEGDALYARTDWTFSIKPYIGDLYGNAKQWLIIDGKQPRNNPSGTLPPPVIARQGTQGGAGTGHLQGGNTPHYFCATAVDFAGNEGMPSDLCEVVIAGSGSTYSASIPVYGYSGGTVLFRVYGYHSTVGMTWLQDVTPGSNIFVTEWNENSYGVPDGECSGIILRMRQVRHGGVAGQIVTEVGTNTLTVPGAGIGGFDWTGRTVTLCAKADRTELPIWNANVVSQSGDVLTTDLDPTGVIAPNDVILMSFHPTLSGLRVTDTYWKNPLSNGGHGLAPRAEHHKVWRCIAGTGRGEFGSIVNNGDDWMDLSAAPLTTPDSTSRWIVEEPFEFPETADTPNINNGDINATFSAQIPTDNYKDMLVRVEAACYDGGGNESPSWGNPERMIWLLGDYNTRTQPIATVAQDVTLS